MQDITDLLESELERRDKRNVRDRLAREFLRDHPEIKEDPSIEFDISDIPEGTTESAVRAIARFYSRKKLVRKLIRESV